MALKSSVVSVRRARHADDGRLLAIQLAAGGAFPAAALPAGSGHPRPAGQPPPRRTGRAWVAADEYDEPVGFVVAEVVDGCAYIEQVSVHPGHPGDRIGAILLDHVADWSARHKLRALTLIASRGVPWNAPYYERLGFRELGPAEVTPGLAEKKAAKAAQGGDPSALVCMIRGARTAA
jgi:GNAT superfamily N-acetyltransferase